jgi:moderate conductance mechanosensitive channel
MTLSAQAPAAEIASPLVQALGDAALLVLPRAAQVAFIIVLGFLGYRLARLMIGRLEREIQEEDPVLKRIREQRARTLASILNSIALILIIVVGGLITLSAFEIDIRPILATVGVLSLAISFGAQSLVKDVINGTFLLIEGQYGIGDVVRVGDTAGMVEKITLRTTTLRDLHGVVHVIPNGEISRVSNMTKGWSRAVLEIGVAYKEDVDRVMDVLRDVGAQLAADPDWGALLLEEPQVPGVENFAESGVVVRIVAKTLPLKQWDVARELRRRIKKRFDAERIEIPFPHVTFYWGDGQLPPALGDAAAGHGAGRAGAIVSGND